MSNSEELKQEKKQELGAPADFSTGFDVDITNPFYEAPVNDRKVEAIATIAGDHDEANKPKEEPAAPAKSNASTMSKDDLLKQAKKKKKIAKNIFNARRK